MKICENCKHEHDGSYGSGRFCSLQCKQKFLNKKSIESRRKNHFPRKNGRAPYGTWRCSLCNLIFDTKDNLRQHNVDVHNFQSSVQVEEKYECPYCKRLFNSRFGYASHSPRCKLNPKYDEQDVQRRYERQGKTWSHICQIDKSKTTLGKHLSKETRQKISLARSKNLNEDLKSGRRKDVKWYKVKNIVGQEFTVRGHWEENVAIKLNELNILWTRNKWIEYFDGDIVRHYNPDFYLDLFDAYVEVKGYYPPEDQKKMKLVLDQHKDITIYFIGENEYKKFLQNQITLEECRLL